MIDVRLLEGLEREVALIRVSLAGGHFWWIGVDDYCNNEDADNRKKRVQVQDDGGGNDVI